MIAFKAADELMDWWKRYEEKILRIHAQPIETRNLCIERIGSCLHLTYKGKPISELALREKIEATVFIDELEAAIKESAIEINKALDHAIRKLKTNFFNKD